MEDFLENNYSNYLLNKLYGSNRAVTSSPLYHATDAYLSKGNEDRSISPQIDSEDIISFMSMLLKAIPDKSLPCFEKERELSRRKLSIFIAGLRSSSF